MNKSALLKEIVSTYQKYGWKLRRVLLTVQTRESFTANPNDLFPDTWIETANFDAAWFSRPSSDKREAWELRVISAQPFALFETFPNNLTETNLDKTRREMEIRLFDKVSLSK
ncbi:MAG: hypothetical protein H7Z37_03640 [Pyrinomonadaceae bacterium]|nr:hypothetical protein [Pyrinomonadaceae bacterium]